MEADKVKVEVVAGVEGLEAVAKDLVLAVRDLAVEDKVAVGGALRKR
jgi:hypothetical protein